MKPTKNGGFGKALGFLTGAAIIGSLAGIVSPERVLAASPPVTVIVDGAKINCSPAPQIENGRILVPVASVLESIGYSVEWDDYHKLAKGRMTAADGSKRSVSVNTKTLSATIYEVRANGDRIQFIIPLDPKDAPIKNVDGHLLLPIGVIAKALGCEVGYDGATKTATINTAGANITPPKGWVDAIEKHYAKYAPDQLAAKQSWVDEEAENQRILGNVSASPAPKPADQKGKKYSVFSEMYNKTFEYEYKSPAKPTTAPKVGSVPAKILLDESIELTAYPDPKNPGQWIPNRTEAYTWSGSAVVGGCEWYAGGRFKEVYGIPINCFNGFFRSQDYLDAADQHDEFLVIRDVNDIRDYSLIVYGKGKYNSGHVGFVEYVERDAKGKAVNVYITEANVNNTTGQYRQGIDGAVEKLSMKEFLNQSKPIIGYIIPNPDFFK